MHDFSELIQITTIFSLDMLNNIQKNTLNNFEINAKTPDVKTLQMIQLQKVIISVGMFSMFESIIQKELECKNGFEEAKKILDSQGKTELKEEFSNFSLAINVLKHGKGRSYEILLSKVDILPFKLKLPEESFFCEGDISEVSTLIEIDDTFILNCSKIIYNVSLSLFSKL